MTSSSNPDAASDLVPEATTRDPEVVTLDPDAVYSVNPEFVIATFDDQVLFYHLHGGYDLNLDQPAGLILELVASRCSIAEIREMLQRAYPESSEDVDRTLRYLLRHRVLRRHGVLMCQDVDGAADESGTEL